MARGILCISTRTDLSILFKLKISVTKTATTGKKAVLSIANFNPVFIFVYFLPYKKTPSIKVATADVDLPNMCKDVERGEGKDTPNRDIAIPDKIDMISGFFESFLTTLFNPFHLEPSPSLYDSKTMIEIATLIGEMEAEASVARCSPCSVGKANVINGMPKKDRLPKTVLRTITYRVFLENLITRYNKISIARTIKIGIFPTNINLRVSSVSLISDILIKKRDGNAK
jgi:hypothetical protein